MLYPVELWDRYPIFYEGILTKQSPNPARFDRDNGRKNQNCTGNCAIAQNGGCENHFISVNTVIDAAMAGFGTAIWERRRNHETKFAHF